MHVCHAELERMEHYRDRPSVSAVNLDATAMLQVRQNQFCFDPAAVVHSLTFPRSLFSYQLSPPARYAWPVPMLVILVRRLVRAAIRVVSYRTTSHPAAMLVLLENIKRTSLQFRATSATSARTRMLSVLITVCPFQSATTSLQPMSTRTRLRRFHASSRLLLRRSVVDRVVLLSAVARQEPTRTA